MLLFLSPSLLHCMSQKLHLTSLSFYTNTNTFSSHWLCRWEETEEVNVAEEEEERRRTRDYSSVEQTWLLSTLTGGFTHRLMYTTVLDCLSVDLYHNNTVVFFPPDSWFLIFVWNIWISSGFLNVPMSKVKMTDSEHHLHQQWDLAAVFPQTGDKIHRL